MCELRCERCQSLRRFGHTRLTGFVQSGTGTHQAFVVPLKYARLLRRQIEGLSLIVQNLDAIEEVGVQRNLAGVPCEAGRDVPFNGLERIIRICTCKVEKYGCDACERVAGALKRIDGVGADRVVAVNLPAARCERRGRDEGDSGWSLANADGTRLSSLKVLLCDVGEGWTTQRLGGCTLDS